MLISPFTPLFFNARHRTDGIDSEYVQLFSPDDEILVEVIVASGQSIAESCVSDAITSRALFDIEWQRWEINEDIDLLFAVLSFSPGCYEVHIGGETSEPFRVTSDERLLESTTLIQYSMDSNKNRQDAIFFIDGMQRFFDFRAPGGFSDSGWSFSADSEQFTTDCGDIVQLYALDTVQQKFTLGTSQGCPIWFAELLNRILCCSYVYFDGVRYCRKDASAPEVTTQLEGVNSFVFTQSLQKVTCMNPTLELTNQAILRRVVTDKYRAVTTEINRLIK